MCFLPGNGRKEADVTCMLLEDITYFLLVEQRCYKMRPESGRAWADRAKVRNGRYPEGAATPAQAEAPEGELELETDQ